MKPMNPDSRLFPELNPDLIEIRKPGAFSNARARGDSAPPPPKPGKRQRREDRPIEIWDGRRWRPSGEALEPNPAIC